jgi:L-fuconolactonase
MADTNQLPFILDCHQHFWKYDSVVHNWITDDMSILKQHYLPYQLEKLLLPSNVMGTIAVQAEQSAAETDFLLELAHQHPFIKGVVGWIDLCQPDLTDCLSKYANEKKLKGFRHILQSESPDFMLQKAFIDGLRLIGNAGYTFDLLLYPQHIAAATKLVSQLPHLNFVVDHLAKPHIREGIMAGWQEDIAALAIYPNVYCKLSGLVTEANWKFWKYDDLLPYLDHIVNCFGTSRLMVGSDWPVCLLAASYDDCLDVVRKYIRTFTDAEQLEIVQGNAARFYRVC